MADPNSQTSTPSQNLNTMQAKRLIAKAKAVNVNAIADTAVPVLCATKYSIQDVVFANCSLGITLSTATFGIFTSPGSAGTAILSVTNLSSIIASTTVTVTAPTTTGALTAQQIYFRCILAQGAASTLDVSVYGYDLS